MSARKKPKHRPVTLVRSTYQPSKAEQDEPIEFPEVAVEGQRPTTLPNRFFRPLMSLGGSAQNKALGHYRI